MSWTRLALSNPTATLVAVLLVVLFGGISMSRLPIQLTPEVERPEITIRTAWRAAAPEEVEAEIVEPQEKVLRGLSGVSRMVSKAQRGQGQVSIEFVVGHDLRRGLIEVLNRLNRVARYPDDANEPVIDTVGENSRAIAWFMARPAEGNTRDIQGYKDYAEEVVQTRLERVSGVARSEVYGGREREVRITFDPYKAASLGIQLLAAARLTGGNQDISGGDVNVGKRRYTLRFTGAFDAGELGELVLEWRDGLPVRLRDVADIEVALVDRKSFVLANGVHSIAVNAHREIGVNVLAVMEGLREAAQELAQGPLARAGLTLKQAYDETTYIHRSIGMVRNNLGLGIVLAIAVLWVFLRRFGATLLVAVAIPVSLFAAFLCLDFAGRTVNIISLAGLAFAVGMTLDAAIVVLENIVRLRERGMAAEEAAVMGPEQVWGALLASTATTVAIFLPIVFLEDEAGQLFADLALTIAMAVIASMLVALTVIPAASSRWLGRTELRDRHARWREGITAAIVRLTDGPARRAFWIVTLIAIPLGVSLALAPRSILGLVPVPERLASFIPNSPWALRASYLPQGSRNLVFAFIIPPPGVNIDHLENEMGTGRREADCALPRWSRGAEDRQLLLRRVLPRGVHGGEDGGRSAHRRADPDHQQDDPRFPGHHRVREARIAVRGLRLGQHHQRRRSGPKHPGADGGGARGVHRHQPGAARSTGASVPGSRARRTRASTRARRAPARRGGLEPRCDGVGDPRARRRALRGRLLRR